MAFFRTANGLRNYLLKHRRFITGISKASAMSNKANEENSAFKHFKEWYIDYLASEEYYKKIMLESNWEKTCKYIKDNRLIIDISFQTWIKPMKLIDCSQDCMVFEYIDETISEILKDTVRYIRNRYGQIIVNAYNHCTGSNFKKIEIKYE